MEISCLSTRLCQKDFQEDLRDSLTGAIYLNNRDGSLSILDLNDDCLGEIFMNLNLKQLYDVATVHCRFVAACRRTFSKKYKNKEITISVYQTNRPDYPMVLCLLGDVISQLRVTYYRFDNHTPDEHNNIGIHDAITRHCSNTLTEVTFNHIHPTMAINKPFRNLKKLSFNQGCVGQIMSQFNKWFPILASIEFFFCTTINTKCIEQTFSNLEHFTVAHHNFTFDNLRTFLDLNPQLNSFTVYNYDHKLIHQLEQYTKLKYKLLQTKFEIYPCSFSFNNE